MFDILSFLEKYVNVYSSNAHEVYLDECPFCGKPDTHRTSFGVSRKKPIYHCFRCGQSGHWAKLMSKVSDMSVTQARAKLGEDLGLEVEKKEEKKPLEIFFPPEHYWTTRALKYLERREITEKTREKFGLYFCNRGKYANRIIIPVWFEDKRVTFQARAILDDMEPRYTGPAGSPVSEIWYNWDNWKEGQEIVIVEGPIDTMRMDQNGIFSICPLGKTLSERQIILLTTRISCVTVMPDPDAVNSIGKRVHLLNHYLDVNIVPLFGEKDPGAMNREESKRAMQTSFDNVTDLDRHRLERWRREHVG